MNLIFWETTAIMSMPHAPPTSPPIIPIGHYFEPTADVAGETNFLTGITLLIIVILSLAHNRNTNEVLPPYFSVFTGFLMLLVLHLLNKGREIKFITDASHRRNYLGRFAYRVGTSAVVLLTALFALFLYPQNWVTILTAAGLLGLVRWHVKSPDRQMPFIGTNTISNYWHRITGKATFSQLDYGPGDTVHFTYEDGLMKVNDKRYNVFLNRILECRFESAMGHVDWEREALWSAHQCVSQYQLSKGISFPINGTSKKTITPSYYRLLYWEVILQEVDGDFLERFLVGVDQFKKGGRKRAQVLRP